MLEQKAQQWILLGICGGSPHEGGNDRDWHDRVVGVGGTTTDVESIVEDSDDDDYSFVHFNPERRMDVDLGKNYNCPPFFDEEPNVEIFEKFKIRIQRKNVIDISAIMNED
ncbi:Uncharacterized protein Fot_03434 [Forsythia ovata]|uniref:Uncharacterized protein n=1 Tax=Forsythia ovata TaxID=205694 RepID=A0ABD1XDP0_9LAMI